MTHTENKLEEIEAQLIEVEAGDTWCLEHIIEKTVPGLIAEIRELREQRAPIPPCAHEDTFEEACRPCLAEAYRQLWSTENDVLRLKRENAALRSRLEVAGKLTRVLEDQACNRCGYYFVRGEGCEKCQPIQEALAAWKDATESKPGEPRHTQPETCQVGTEVWEDCGYPLPCPKHPTPPETRKRER